MLRKECLKIGQRVSVVYIWSFIVYRLNINIFKVNKPDEKL